MADTVNTPTAACSRCWGSLPVFARRPASLRSTTEDIFSTPLLTLEALEEQQSNLDEFLLGLSEEVGAALDAGSIPETIGYREHRGNPVSIPGEGALLHVLNHHTHHRGQISQILDAMGIENDYSGLRETL
ncbi:MAG: DinB family protein [Spirochaetota bacterium]